MHIRILVKSAVILVIKGTERKRYYNADLLLSSSPHCAYKMVSLYLQIVSAADSEELNEKESSEQELPVKDNSNHGSDSIHSGYLSDVTGDEVSRLKPCCRRKRLFIICFLRTVG